MRDASNAAVGIDIGGTKTAIAVVDRAGRILATEQFSTEAGRGFQRAVDRMIDLSRGLAMRAGVAVSDLAGLGIGCTGPLDTERGTINNPWTLEGWNDCDVVTPLRGVQVRLRRR